MTVKYNFDEPTKRRNTYSMKWNVAEQDLPMWVADMDFKTAPEITEAIIKRAAHGIFGYTDVPDAWYQAYINWWKLQYGFSMEKEWMMFCTGVVPAVSSIVRKLTTVGEKVLVQTPVYNIFFNSIINNGRQVLECPLRYDGNEYEIDFVDLEKKLSDPQTTLMILCNPHNPVGRIWDRETLEQIGDLCDKHHVKVLSDEIHGPLTEPGYTYVPFASVSEKCRMNSITCIAPTKAFNLAGLQTAAVVVPNEDLRNKITRGLNTDEVAEPNVFAVEAAIAAFANGEAWLQELRTYIWENRKAVEDFLKKELPEVKLVNGQATYLLWLDASGVIGDAAELCEYIRRETGLYLSPGLQYGQGGRNFMRMNIACQREKIWDALNRLKAGVKKYQSWVIERC